MPTDSSDELCEIITPMASTMHQPMEDEPDDWDWWICPEPSVGHQCQEVFYDGEIQVACAY